MSWETHRVFKRSWNLFTIWDDLSCLTFYCVTKSNIFCVGFVDCDLFFRFFFRFENEVAYVFFRITVSYFPCVSSYLLNFKGQLIRVVKQVFVSNYTTLYKYFKLTSHTEICYFFKNFNYITGITNLKSFLFWTIAKNWQIRKSKENNIENYKMKNLHLSDKDYG